MTTRTDPRLAEIRQLRETDTDEAERRARALAAERPDDLAVHELLVSVLSRRVDTDAIAEVARATLARHPDWTAMADALANAHYHSGDLDAAYEVLSGLPEQRLTVDPALRLGVLAHAVGKREAAFDALHGALAASAGGDVGPQAQAWVALMRLHRDEGRTRFADDAARAARALYAKKPVWVSSSVSKLVNRRDFPEYERMRRKDGLGALLATAPRGKRPSAPATYLLPAERERLLADAAAGTSGPVWIVKAGDLFGGQGISLTDDPAAIPADTDAVVQHYIDRPFLADGHKGHFRLYLLITSVDPLRAWLWRDGLVRLAPARFEQGPGWLDRTDMHITNTALHKGHPGLSFDPDPTVEDRGSVQGLAAFLRRALSDQDQRRVWRRLDRLAHQLLELFAEDGVFFRQAVHGRAFLPKLLGLDVLLDETLRPWLIELQRVPGQTGPGPVNTVNARMFRTVFEMSVAPLADLPGRTIAARETVHEARSCGAFVRV